MIYWAQVILSCIKKRRLLSASHASTNPLKHKSHDLRKVFWLENITSHGQNHAQIRPLELTASIFGQVCWRKVASTNHVELKSRGLLSESHANRSHVRRKSHGLLSKIFIKVPKLVLKKCMLYMSSMVMHFGLLENAIFLKKREFESFFS